MAQSWPISTLLLLCAVTASIKANAENATEHNQPTTTSGHTTSETHPQQLSTTEPQGTQDEDDDSGESDEMSMLQANSTDMNMTNEDRSNNTSNRPSYRRYIDLRKNLPIVEKSVNGSWARIRPPLTDGEQHETNISRYAYFPNGSRVALRSKFDYSHDDMNWFRSSRIKIPITQFANGSTIYQFRFGPKRWIGAYRNRIFRPDANLSGVDLSPGGPHHNAYRFDEEDAFFRQPRGPYMGNGSRRQAHSYGGARRFGRPYYNRYDYGPPWNPRGGYPDYYGPRPPYPPRAYTDPYYDDPRYRQGDDGYYDRRYRPAGPYDDSRYTAPGGAYDDRRYYSGRYRSDGYESARGYDDKRYHADETHDDGKYPPRDAAPSYRTYDNRGSSDRAYDARGASDRTYDTRGPSDRAPNYDTRRRDQSYENSYDRGDRRAYEERSSGSYNGSRYDEHSSNENQYPRSNYRQLTNNRRRYAATINRPHGDSYEEFKWKFPYLDKSRIPQDEGKREKYFLREFHDILAKSSKNLWKLHRNLRTILPDYDTIKQEEPTISDPNVIVNVVNGSMTLVNDLITRIDGKMESNLTIDDVIQPIDRGTYTRTMNGFDKMVDLLRDLRKPSEKNDNLDNLITKLVDYKRGLYVLYSDITHMITILRRTMKKYGLYVMGT